MNTALAALAAAVLLVGLPAAPAAAGSRTYEASDADFANPERGFWRFVAEDFAAVTPGELADLRRAGLTMAYGVVRLDRYRERKGLPPAFLRRLQAAFAKTREAGAKVTLRFVYNYPKDEFEYRNAKDAALDVVKSHIEQLTPVFAANADVVAALQAGFIGAWGEGHTSSNGLDEPAAKAELRDALLNLLPPGRMLQWRYPADVIGWSPAPSTSGPFARVGLHNDCFMSSRTDVGTYSRKPRLRAEQRAYAAALSRTTLYGGETCDVGSKAERCSCAAIPSEGPTFHLTTLNGDYNRAFIRAWKDGGCYDEVRRSMGYRLALTSAQAPDALARGAAATVTIALRNLGWARLHNPRPLRLVIVHRASGATYERSAARDVRDAEPEDPDPTAFAFRWTPPPEAPRGDYDLAIAMPDAAPSLAQDPRYAVRPANASGGGAGWDAAAGRFDLGLSIRLTD